MISDFEQNKISSIGWQSRFLHKSMQSYENKAQVDENE